MVMYLGPYMFQIQNINIDIFLGIGGGPEGVLAAAALRCL